MLPQGWAIRPTADGDAKELLALVHASDVAMIGFPDFEADDVANGMGGPASLVACDPAGKILGWGFLDNSTQGERDFVEVYTHPDGGLPAQRPLLARLLEQVARRGTYARAGAVPAETEWIASLEAAGFVFIKQYARMRIDLQVALPSSDITIRPVRQEELPTFHGVIDEAFRDTPDYLPRTYEQWRARFVDGHQVRWDEWLVAIVDGQIAGVLQSKGDEGWVQNLAVARAFRRRRVGKALLTEAFKIYTIKGYREAGLGVDLENPTQAIRLYTGVGMQPAYQANIYERR